MNKEWISDSKLWTVVCYLCKEECLATHLYLSLKLLFHYSVFTPVISLMLFYWKGDLYFAALANVLCCYNDLCICVFVCIKQESVDLGEIMFSLCYLPTAGRLTLTVIKCRNLKAMDITGYSGRVSVTHFTALEHLNTAWSIEVLGQWWGSWVSASLYARKWKQWRQF